MIVTVTRKGKVLTFCKISWLGKADMSTLGKPVLVCET